MRERPDRVTKLRTNARALRGALADEGFPVGESPIQIVPLIIGDEHETMGVCRAALERGIFAQGIRPPTVPAGTGRLRLTVMATHTPAELREAAAALGGVGRARWAWTRRAWFPGSASSSRRRVEPLYAVPGDEDPDRLSRRGRSTSRRSPSSLRSTRTARARPRSRAANRRAVQRTGGWLSPAP